MTHSIHMLPPIIKLRKVHLFFLLAILVGACDESRDEIQDVESYYYPFAALENGMVYEYNPVDSGYDPPIYWYFKSEKVGKSKYLTGTSYGPSFLPDQTVREEWVENGILLRDFITYEKTDDGESIPVRAAVLDPNVFSFKVKKYGAVVVSTIQWSSLTDSVHYTFVRNRQFEADTSFIYDGITIDAVRFVTRELIDQEQQGHLELEYGGMEIYAKGIGLVFFSKDINDDWQMKYRLNKTYSPDEFQKKYGVQLKVQQLD